MDEFEPVKQRIREAPLSDPPEPWQLLGTVAIGDILEVGFADDSGMIEIGVSLIEMPDARQ